jgi:tRNA-specific 2-thiouridylase
LNFEETFRRNVVERFADDYAAGRTPNPCVSCNNFVKLGTLLRYADSIGASYVATGHYARLEHGPSGPRLFRSPSGKDQAYALAQLTPEQLQRLLLPLGDLDKPGTRAQARRLGLEVHDKTESQDICFVEGGDYRDVLERIRPGIHRTGSVVTTSGNAVGTHTGIAGYTIGQRSRLPGGAERAQYVTGVDATTNTVVIGDELELLAAGLEADEFNAIRPERFGSDERRVLATIRYRGTAVPASARVADGLLHMRFDLPQRAVTPGQLVAVYDEDGAEVLGAATIRRAA